jgi:hypothetical protein
MRRMKIQKRNVVVVAVCAVVLGVPLLACDKLGGGFTVAGSCDWRPGKSDRCFEYPKDGVEAGKKICTGGKVWSDGPCDRASAVCGTRMSSNTQKWIYETNGTTKDKANTECLDGKLLGPDGKPK